ncbi:ubiquitin carboxyl-terminal hydrolase 3 isoform X2 [Mus musculus]|uniref:ubiquitin carboxyl-terminal hydrolase 3 isoform X2 n=2 Tax=Mus musculus TaxID=10090 RepID=UPI0003D70D0C|nr:ubiquitin carboxyl-terminal hydrolase 3 isoform X2 [Mus musculus]
MTRRLAPQGSANLRAGSARGRTCGGVGLAVPRGPDRQSAALRAQLCLDCRRASPFGLRFLGFPQAPASPAAPERTALGAAHLGVSLQPVRVKFENRLRAPKAPEKAANSCFGGAARVCRSNKSPWVCLTCSSVHCGRYVNGHAKKHYEDAQIPLLNHKRSEKQEKAQHTVCMDCSSYSTYCYRCDDFVVNDTKLGLVQKVREHLQNLENSAFTADRHRKRKLLENSSLNSKLLKVNGSTTAICATGLRNLGNTCFMNAILQSLRSLVEEFRKTLCALWQGSQTAFSPESLFYVVWKIMPNFRGYQQQDAHEFMRYLLDHLHLELQGGFNGVSRSAILQENSTLSASNKCCINGASTVVTAIFGGILQNEVNCLICGTESRKFDPFLDLSLDIPSQFRSKRSKNQENGPVCSLRDCLRSFTDLEELDETELYMCHKCKKKQKSTKKFWIQKLPKALCLHLKRFHWTAYLRNKVDTYVQFPLRGLDMKCYLLEPENSGPDSCLYDLAAVVVHHGSGVGSGHYTAYAVHEGRWFHFNDSTVTVTDEETVGKAKAYILFYVERQARAGAEKL